ncbi:hypothetical protein HN51_067978 [Arachis hypogaea]
MLSEIFDRVAIEEGHSSSALVAYKKMTIDQFLKNSNKSSITFEFGVFCEDPHKSHWRRSYILWDEVVPEKNPMVNEPGFE